MVANQKDILGIVQHLGQLFELASRLTTLVEQLYERVEALEQKDQKESDAAKG